MFLNRSGSAECTSKHVAGDSILSSAHGPNAWRNEIFPKTITIPTFVRAAIFDFDGTCGLTEHAHRTTFRRGLEHLCDISISPLEWRKYKSAFGLPEHETCVKIIELLNRLHPHVFDTSDRIWLSLLRENHPLGSDWVFELDALRRAGSDNFANPEYRDFLASALKQARLHVFREMLEESHSRNIIQPVPHALQLIEQFKRAGVAVAICTGSADHFVLPVLKHFGFDPDRLDAKVFCNDSRNLPGKPDPAPYEAILRDLGVTQEQAIAFEDSASGATAAYRAGIPVIIRAVNPSKFFRVFCELVPDMHHKPLDNVRLVNCWSQVHLEDQAKPAHGSSAA